MVTKKSKGYTKSEFSKLTWEEQRALLKQAIQKENESIYKDPNEPFEDWFYRKMDVENPNKK